MRRISGIVVVALLGGGCITAPPVPPYSASPVLSPLPSSADLASLAPPPSIREPLAKSGMEFRPLTVAELALVHVTPESAISTALANRSFSYGSSATVVIWEKTGCVLLGMLEDHRYFPHASPQPPRPTYLIQVVTDPIENFPKLNIAVVAVDAGMGGQGFALSGGPSGFGILGTTCGVTW